MSAETSETAPPPIPSPPYRAVVDYTEEERRDYARLIGMLKREWGVEETSGVVLRALREAAQRT